MHCKCHLHDYHNYHGLRLQASLSPDFQDACLQKQASHEKISLMYSEDANLRQSQTQKDCNEPVVIVREGLQSATDITANKNTSRVPKDIPTLHCGRERFQPHRAPMLPPTLPS